MFQTPGIEPWVADVVERVRVATGRRHGPIALHEPEFGGHEWEYLKECLDTGWVSSVGRFVDRFERDLERTTGVAHAIATASGTAALHACLLLAGVKRGDEVLLPSLTFIATANAVSYTGATPHFIDSEARSLGVDPKALDNYLHDIAEVGRDGCVNRRSGARIRALVVVHVFGHPCDLDALAALAARWQLVLIEDAAESLGSTYRGRHTGNVGLLAALSFNGNKVVTTGGGGAVLTNDAALAQHAKHLTTTARVPHRWSFLHDEVAYNYRLPNLNAALGCAQLEQLPLFIERKRRLAERYMAAFDGAAGVRVLCEPEDTASNYWLVTLLLDEPDLSRRDALLAALNDVGLTSRPVWTLMHRLPMYTGCPRAPLPLAEALEARIVNVPSSPRLAD